MRTLVLQSHRDPLPYPWLHACVQSVKRWSEAHGFEYRWLDDSLFDVLTEAIRRKTRDQLVVASDLARLLQLQKALAEGYDTVVWCDADLLVFDADRLLLPAHSYAVGREVWVQSSHREWASTPKVYKKVHNAFMQFRAGNSFLDFYSDTAAHLLGTHPGPFVSQFIGPKLLTALHNIITMPVVENAGVLSPAVARDLLQGGGKASEAFIKNSQELPAALNLCSSSIEGGELTNDDLIAVSELLLERGSQVFIAK